MRHASDIADFYDHERERSLPPGCRSAPDWGADDLFDGSRVGRSSRSRGAATRTRDRERPVADWLAESEHGGSFGHSDADLAPPVTYADDDPPAVALAPHSAPTRELELPPGERRPERRTVTITGHPEAVRRAQRSGELARRRPGRTLEARIGHRPDQVAMMACALGVLLVLVAILTAGA